MSILKYIVAIINTSGARRAGAPNIPYTLDYFDYSKYSFRVIEMMRRGIGIGIGIAAVIGVAAVGIFFARTEAGDARRTQGRYPLDIVATVGMVGDMVAEIVGEYGEVATLIGSGVDPHLYAPTRDDVRKLLAADMVYYVGLQLEGRMATVLEQQGEERYALADFVPAEAITAGGGHDPHIWMDVSLWAAATHGVVQRLAAFDAAHADYYYGRADAYRHQLEELDRYAHAAIASIPMRQRVLITAHDAFGYFGRRYDIAVEGVQGLSTESEAGLQRINFLVDLLVERKMRAIFVESSVHDKNVRALIEGARARGHGVAIGGVLFSDAMGEQGSYRGSYIGMLDHNATTISRALGGNAPSGGWLGRL